MDAEIRQKLLALSNQLLSMSSTINEYSESFEESSDKHSDLEEFSQIMQNTAQKINDFL